MPTPTPLLQRPWPWIAAGFVVLLALIASMIRLPSPPGAWDTRPLGTAEDIEALRERDDVNILFILIDTLRAERLGSYGYARDTSPLLDRLAANGMRFANHLSQSSWTKTSMASLWTAQLPQRAGVTRFDHVLPPEARMPAEVLREAGFRTIGLYRNGWVAPTFGFDQGFEVYKKPTRRGLDPSIRRQNPTLSDASTDESVVSAAVEFLRLRGDERWFLYLHMMDVHEYLFDEESALFGTAYSDVYDNSIRWTDGMLEVLFSSLAEVGAFENTLIVIGSDHGEAFGERGFEGHARKVYRETTEVPLFLLFPFRLEPGAVVTSRTSNVDIWPTVLDLVGLEMGDTDGRSRRAEILASVRGEVPTPSDSAAIAHLDQTWARPEESPDTTIAVVDGPLRYVRIEQTQGAIEQLFDSTDDPLELQNHAATRPEEVERLRKIGEAYLEGEPDWGETPVREIGELELNHLRALGYALP